MVYLNWCVGGEGKSFCIWKRKKSELILQCGNVSFERCPSLAFV